MSLTHRIEAVLIVAVCVGLFAAGFAVGRGESPSVTVGTTTRNLPSGPPPVITLTTSR